MLSSKAERFQQIVEKNESDYFEPDSEVKTLCGDGEAPWFHCDYKTFRNRADYLFSFFSHPLINPFLYRHQFDQLKEIALFLFVGKYDFLLDQNIELSKLWQGSVCLDVFDKLIHGFLPFHGFSVECSEALEVVVKRFQEACGLI